MNLIFYVSAEIPDDRRGLCGWKEVETMNIASGKKERGVSNNAPQSPFRETAETKFTLTFKLSEVLKQYQEKKENK